MSVGVDEGSALEGRSERRVVLDAGRGDIGYEPLGYRCALRAQPGQAEDPLAQGRALGREIELGLAAHREDDECEVVLLLPRVDLHLGFGGPVADEDIGPGLARGRLHRRERGEQQRLTAVGRDREGGADGWLTVLVQGVHEVKGRCGLCQQRLEGVAHCGDLLDRRQLGLDLGFGRVLLGLDRVLGVFDRTGEAVDEAVDLVLVLAEAVFVIRVQNDAGQRRTEAERENECTDAEHRAGKDAPPPARFGLHLGARSLDRVVRHGRGRGLGHGHRGNRTPAGPGRRGTRLSACFGGAGRCSSDRLGAAGVRASAPPPHTHV